MSKAKNILYNILLGVIAAAFGIGFWAIGFFIAADNHLGIVLFVVSVSVLGVLCIINIVCSIVLSRKLGKMNMRELYDYMNDVRVKAQGNINGARKKTNRIVVFAYIYLALIFGLTCLIAFASGMADFGVETPTIVLLLIIYILWGVFDILLKPVANDVNRSNVELTDKDFPLILKTVERAAAAVGFSGNIKLFLVGSEVTVNEYRGTVYITIGYKEAALFTQDELYSVILHELAHVVNADVRRTTRLLRIQERWACDTTANATTFVAQLMFFKCFSLIINYNIGLYNLFSSIEKERAADETVKRLDSDGCFADALAKTKMIAKYDIVPVPETEYYFFEPELPQSDFATLDYKTYLEYFQKYGDVWRAELINELPPRVGTHPTVRMRIQSFGRDVQSCNCNAMETDHMYMVEQQRILERADAYIAEMVRDTYAEQREKMYVQRKAAIDELDGAEASGAGLSGAARENALWALLGIDDDRTILLADRMIADGDRAAAANFAKGYVYKRRHDDRCVECFKNAATEPLYAEEAYSLIGEYALLTGNEKLIEEYRADVPEVMQAAQDKMKDDEFKSNTPTEPCDLDVAVIAELANKINAAAGNAVKKIYVTKYTTSDGETHYPFAFDLTAKAAFRNNNDLGIFYCIYDIIQSYNGEPSFILCNPKMGLIRNVKHANGVTVYDCVKQAKVEK